MRNNQRENQKKIPSRTFYVFLSAANSYVHLRADLLFLKHIEYYILYL